MQDPFENLIYLEQDPLERYPDLRNGPRKMGMIAASGSRRMATSIRRDEDSTVGIEAEYWWGNLSSKPPSLPRIMRPSGGLSPKT